RRGWGRRRGRSVAGRSVAARGCSMSCRVCPGLALVRQLQLIGGMRQQAPACKGDIRLPPGNPARASVQMLVPQVLRADVFTDLDVRGLLEDHPDGDRLVIDR